jgi:uncharacterized protein involved in exopolysaccharide biosynthesis
MTRWLIRLYPAAWRKRYGDELEELMGDVPAGWAAALDLFKGAITMRLRYQSAYGIVLAFMVTGVLCGLLASWLTAPMWQASVAGQITPMRISANQRQDGGPSVAFIRQTMDKVLSRNSLMNLVTDPRLNLYQKERLTTPLEQIEDTMRRNIRVAISSDANPRNGSRVFKISFAYPDARKALNTTNGLITRLIFEATSNRDAAGFSIDILDPPTLPQRPISPSRTRFMLIGFFTGLVLALVALLARRRMQPPGPGLQSA